jgi:hypothetical protein
MLSLEKLPQVCRDVKHIKRHLGLDAAEGKEDAA